MSDLDVATVLGIGFPDFRGGVLKYAYDLGLGRVLAELDQLAERWGERFSPCPLLRESGGKEDWHRLLMEAGSQKSREKP